MCFALDQVRVATDPAAGVGGRTLAAVVEQRAFLANVKLAVFVDGDTGRAWCLDVHLRQLFAAEQHLRLVFARRLWLGDDLCLRQRQDEQAAGGKGDAPNGLAQGAAAVGDGMGGDVAAPGLALATCVFGNDDDALQGFAVNGLVAVTVHGSSLYVSAVVVQKL